MSVMLTWLADALRAEGCKVSEQSGWKSYGRPGAFDPDGPGWHHTGTTTSSSNTHPTLNTCINGRSDLEGPLCQVMIGYDGTCYVIAAGRANHGGACNGWGPYTSSRDANDQIVGIEIDYDGTQKMSAAQQDAATRVSAAVLKRLKHDEGWATRHEEWSTTGKWDTGGLSGDKIRSLVRDYLAHGPADEGVFGMSTLAAFSHDAVQKFTGNGGFLTVHIGPDGAMSLLTGPKDSYCVTTGVTLSGSGNADSVVEGDIIQLRYQTVVDYPDNRATTVEGKYPITEVHVTSGDTYGNLEWLNSLKDASGDAKLRLRLFVKPPDGKSLKVTKVLSRIIY